MPGILTSSSTRSGVSRSTSARPSCPVAAPTNSYPSYSRVMRNESRIAASSSIIRIRGFGISNARGAPPPLACARRVHASRKPQALAPGASLSIVDADRLELPLIDVGRVHVEGEDLAGLRRSGDPAEVGDRFDRLAVDFEQHAAALDVGVERRARPLARR